MPVVTRNTTETYNTCPFLSAVSKALFSPTTIKLLLDLPSASVIKYLRCFSFNLHVALLARLHQYYRHGNTWQKYTAGQSAFVRKKIESIYQSIHLSIYLRVHPSV